MAEQVRTRIRVRGRVQGVGFRYFTVRAARGLGLAGWVKNMPDGSVLCEAQGPPEDVDELVARLRDGPSFARVSAVDVEGLPPDPAEADFDVAF